MPLTKVPTLFKCDRCGKEYNKVKSLRAHMETHSGVLHECVQCGKQYKKRGILLMHKRTAHCEAGHVECDECGKFYRHKNALYAHKRTVHSDREFECPICGMKLRPGSASKHTKMHTGVGQSSECDVCGKIYRHLSGLVGHKRREHSEAKHRCEHCGKNFVWASMLRRHVVTHDENREAFRCSQCPRTFTSLRIRENHMRTEHSDSRFTCDSECGLHSATRSEYLEHLTSQHAKQHPVTCKCVSVEVMVARHVATNLGNTTFIAAEGTMKCSDGDCGFATTCARQMEAHKEQSHHDAYQPVLRCVSCKMWFANPSNLRSHNAVKHQGERRFKCDVCGYISNHKVNFVKHQMSCKQGTAVGNIGVRVKTEPTIENLDVKKETPRGVYHFGSQLGEGGFGKVYEAVRIGEDPPVKYAIKETKSKGGKSAEIEAKRMRQFDHKNLMALLEYYEWKKGGRLTRFIVMECCLPGSLTTMQRLIQFRFEERHVLYILKDVACGLEHLHSAGVIHRDLKSANVLVNVRSEVKIADFGVSTGKRIAFNCRGTPGWVSPEVVDAAFTGITGLVSAYTQKADVYSVGVLAIDCFLPRETLPTDFLHKNKVESEFFAETQLQRIEDDRGLRLSKAFKELVTRCLAPMTIRPSAAAVQKIPAVKKASVEPFKELVEECLKQVFLCGYMH